MGVLSGLNLSNTLLGYAGRAEMFKLHAGAGFMLQKAVMDILFVVVLALWVWKWLTAPPEDSRGYWIAFYVIWGLYFLWLKFS